MYRYIPTLIACSLTLLLEYALSLYENPTLRRDHFLVKVTLVTYHLIPRNLEYIYTSVK